MIFRAHLRMVDSPARTQTRNLGDFEHDAFDGQEKIVFVQANHMYEAISKLSGRYPQVEWTIRNIEKEYNDGSEVLA